MKRLFNSFLIAVLLAASAFRPEIAAKQPETGGIENLLDRWDTAPALEMFQRLPEQERNSPKGRTLLATIYFLDGRYGEAVETMEEITGGRDESLLKIMKNSLKETAGMKKIPLGGSIEVYIKIGVDEILPLYMEEPLATGLERAEKMLNLGANKQKLRIEIFPDAAAFAKMTPLSADDVMNTGVAGICKYNKVMLLSPSAFDYGYKWMDTLMHEVIHLLLIRNFGEGVDIWFQEAFAKYFESIWRDEEGGEMPQASLAALFEAAGKNRLLPFQSFYPSLAKFSSAEEVEAAFAQLQLTMEYLIMNYGMDALHDILKGIGHGMELRDILKERTGRDIKKLFAEVKGYVKKKSKEFPGLNSKSAESSKGCKSEKCDAQKFLRLGDILMEKGFTAAAAVEYQKGIGKANGFHPELEARLAGALMDAGQIDEAQKRLEMSKKFYHGYPVLDALLGKALFFKGRNDESLKILENVIWINPLDIGVHRILAGIYKKSGLSGLYERENKAVQILSD
ncbi:MAG: hypothetical protein FJ088_03630 [Deltaproteobacteria bacterium]|nr:hypothetical protein [Deltaproteobacteria bacterium]